MKRIRINNDIRVDLSVSRNGLPENFGNLTEVDGLTLLFRNLNQSGVQIIPASYAIDGGSIDMVITADQVLHAGKYVFIIQYRQVNVLNPDGYDTITWDSEAFEIVNSTSQVGGSDPVVTYSVDLFAEIGIGLKGTDGASAFELWVSEPANVAKTIDDYYVWLREPAVTAAQAAIAATTAANEAEVAHAAAEGLRVSAETARATAEGLRVSAETARVNADSLRAEAAQAQATAEGLRVTAEQARVTAENARKSAETARVNAEDLRDASESDRAEAETARATAEGLRVSAETARVNAENARKAAETARVNAETARNSAETGRVNAETARANAETARANAESLRVAAEQARVTAETARELYIAGIRTEFNYYRAINAIFSINANMELEVNIPDGSTDSYTLNSNGELILTY